ncbi:hypothetical protein [Puniceibacterium sediminis]|uniref:Uncharacterized protein n=1 Tax=Puniceibacterium sediminis TaxID=1608407 RepID=A0A238V1H1_9RHOB|nr:hypothetical protein [Puniceibacterium sediminis]SNR28068.1 hypothetical protein SAMN06265370_101469 [Puniceibacterium sediminis]
MTRLFAIAAGMICVAAAAWAATGALDDGGPTVIEIEVTAGKLSECRATLAQVARMPAVSDSGTPILFGVNEDLPTVACVVR